MSVTDVILLSFLVTNFILSSICVIVLYLHKKYGSNGLFKTKIVVHRHVYDDPVYSEPKGEPKPPEEKVYTEDVEIKEETD